MAAEEPLHVYLHDHLSGSAVGTDLAKRNATHYQGTPLGEFLTELSGEIEVDRLTLEQLAQRVGATRGALKQMAGELFEKASQVKLGNVVTGQDRKSVV